MEVLTEEEARQNVAANLTRHLESRGWSQRDLANATGVPEMTISRVIRGQNVPGIIPLAAIAEALDISIEALIRAPRLEPQKNSRRSA